MKVIDAVTVTSKEIKRQQIQFTDDEDGHIVAVGDLGLKPDYYFDDSCFLFAGMGDVHIHAREDVSQKNTYKEDFLSAQSAMRNGGVTHAGDMPNNPVPPIDDESYINKVKLGEKASGELWFYAGVGPNTRPLSFAVPYKVYMGPSVGDLFFKDIDSLEEALSRYEGQVVSFHCEDPEILDDHKSKSHHHERRPVEAEVLATKEAIRLIEKFKLKGKLCHYSSGEGLNLVREARKRGVDVSLEVTPQHLYFEIEKIQEGDYNSFQMNPPIRSSADRMLMWEAFKNGEIQFLATDHAPHTLDEKKAGISGLTGLDTFGPFVTWLIKEGIPPQFIAKFASENPGEFFNQFLESFSKLSMHYRSLGKGLGFLLPEYRANFTVLNMNKPITISESHLKTKVGHSPFTGVTFPGQVEALFIGGQKV